MADEKKKTFKVGDTVKLVSDGPVMTVIGEDDIAAIRNKEAYDCTWFSDRNVLRRQSFPVEALVKFEKAPNTL